LGPEGQTFPDNGGDIPDDVDFLFFNSGQHPAAYDCIESFEQSMMGPVKRWAESERAPAKRARASEASACERSECL
jgi:hypothetical protein